MSWAPGAVPGGRDRAGRVADGRPAARTQGLAGRPRSWRATLATIARKVLGWPKIRELAHTFLWEYGYKMMKLAQLLGQLGVFLTLDVMLINFSHGY
jgi:hypothetical protein